MLMTKEQSPEALRDPTVMDTSCPSMSPQKYLGMNWKYVFPWTVVVTGMVAVLPGVSVPLNVWSGGHAAAETAEAVIRIVRQRPARSSLVWAMAADYRISVYS
jgi:hypothetical protein